MPIRSPIALPRLAAFVVTSLPSVDRTHLTHRHRLLQASPLSRLLWANLALHDLTFTTIDRSPSF